MTSWRAGSTRAALAGVVAAALLVGDSGGASGGRRPRAEAASRRKTLWTRDLERSVALFRAALAADPHDAEAATNLGRALNRLGRHDEAIEAWRTAIRLAPTRWVAYAGFADVWSRDERRWQKSAEILEVLETGLSRVPSDGSAVGLVIATANFERSIGRGPTARRRLEGLDRFALSGEDRKRALDLLDTIRVEEEARALLDWPEPAVTPRALSSLAAAEAKLSRRLAREAMGEAVALAAANPGWRGPVWLEARALEQLGRFDEAERRLTVLLQLAPSQAGAWRHLGRILAEHGGSLDGDRADEALARALALEPGWWDLWLLRARVAVRRGRGGEARQWIAAYLRSAGLAECGPLAERAALRGSGDPRCAEAEAQIAPLRASLGAEEPRPVEDRPPSGSRAPPAPTAHARDLYRDAQGWLAVDDPIGLAPDLLAQALAESPGFIEAAVSAYAVGGEIPDATVQALWQDGDLLLELARRVRPLVPMRRATRLTHDEEVQLAEVAPGPATATESAPAVDGAPVVEAAPVVDVVERGSSSRPARSSRPPPPPPIEAWLDRAVALGGMEARFERGIVRLDRGDREGGLDDLRRYVASGARPARLDEARVRLAIVGQSARGPRPGTVMPQSADGGEPVSAPETTPRRCDDGTPDDELATTGAWREWSGDLPGAADCYRALLRREPPRASGPLDEGGPFAGALRRVAGIGARGPMSLTRRLEPLLERAATSGVPVAEWALGRILLERGDLDGALARIERYLGQADAEDPNREPARAARARLVAEQQRRQKRRTLELLGAMAAALAAAALVLLVLLRGRTLARALERRPALFPDVARSVGELRHDVLKHRTSALGLLASGQVAAGEVARVLWEPERASTVIARTYEQLRAAASAHGVTLRPLSREPLFGPLERDLRRAEALARRPSLSAAQREELGALDTRLREQHAEQLASLLRLGPRTRVDAERVAGWIRGAQAELSLRGQPWSPPVLHLGRLDLDFPVEPEALSAIFGNLLRNAQAAVAGGPAPSAARPQGSAEGGGVIVRVDEERDDTGRRLLVLQVGDSSSAGLSLSDIEGRESGRGLAIVRDLVHRWRGHLAIRPEEAPWNKAIAACFPAAT